MPPAHYTFKIDSFSLLSNLLSKSEVEKYESDTFEAGGYKWKLSLYPSGRKERNANGYISLYLVMVETDTLPLGWEINVKFNIFVYDQIRDEYLTFQDGNGGVVRFHGMKTEHGFPQLLPLVNFNNASNGYLVDDSCIFGAEIFVIKSTGNGECVSILETGDDFHSWELKKFSTLNTERCWSEEFKSGEHKWKLMVDPKGVSSQRGEYLCLGIKRLADTPLPPGKQLFAEYRLRIRDQIHGQHHEKTGQLALFLRFTVPSYYSLAHYIINLNSKTTSFEQHFAFKSSKGQIKVLSAVKRFS